MTAPYLQRILILFALFSLSGMALAQAPDYPKTYFRNPLGIPILLAGNFGECRPGHFHSGIDIKTLGKENQPVYAAADGYISRIKMEPGGFGHGLYIIHPNGYTTLYAHLNNFTPALQAYVRQKQYAAQSWTVDISFKPDQFPVKKGQQIAFSGNTGGSTAPHLHFEIRDTKTEHPLNPQLFGFDIKDTKAPVPLKLAVYNRERSIYKDAPALLPLKLDEGVYKPSKDTLQVNQLTGIGLEANDFMPGSENTLAFYTAEWYLDDQLQGRIRLNDIGYDETRYLHAYADYKTKQKGPWIQCLFKVKGNGLDNVYESLNPNSGILDLGDHAVHRLEVRLADAYGNKTNVQCKLQYTDERSPEPRCANTLDASVGTSIDRNDLRYALDNKVLYDDVCGTEYSEARAGSASRSLRVLSTAIPAHHYFPLSIRPSVAIPFDLRSKVAMIYSDGKKESGQAATSDDKGWYKASVRLFGDYRLDIDTIAPVIMASAAVKGNLMKAKKINFLVKDAKTSVKTFRGELDGAWILFEQHESNWFYEFDAHWPKGTHQLTVKATDENSNTITQTFTFTR